MISTLKVLSYTDDFSELLHILQVLENQTSYSDDIILKNLNGSYAIIAFIYKCFYLINVQMYIRSSIIHDYLNSLKICDLIIYYQYFIYEFINKYEHDFKCINEMNKFIRKPYCDLFKCSIW